MLDRLAVLDRSAFFAEVTAEHRRALAGLAREERFPAARSLFREGEQADAFLVLADGQVELSLPLISRAPITPGQGPAAAPPPGGGGVRAGVTLRTVARPGAPVGWSAVVSLTGTASRRSRAPTPPCSPGSAQRCSRTPVSIRSSAWCSCARC
jgi:CRP-like cAMP-binding protein